MSNAFDNSHPLSRLSESDRDKLRRAYRQSPAVWRFVPGRGSAKHLRKWLGQQGPADWHEIALHFDLSGKDLAPLHFIASQPDADRASIMSMVLDLGLSELEREALRTSRGHIHKTRPEQARLLDLISDGFAHGFYKTDKFRMNQPQVVLTRMHVLDPLEDVLCLNEDRWQQVPNAMAAIGKEGRGAVVILRDSSPTAITSSTSSVFAPLRRIASSSVAMCWRAHSVCTNACRVAVAGNSTSNTNSRATPFCRPDTRTCFLPELA